MRAIAAVAVAVHHSIPHWKHYAIVAKIGIDGYLGVPFFFILSGFVMMWTWHHGGQTLFLARRFARIYPIVFLGLVISLASYAAFGDPGAGHAGPKVSILYNLLLIQAWFSNDPAIRQSWDGVSWTLSCEAFFYVIAPLLLGRLSQLNLRLCAIFVSLLAAVDFLIQAIVVPKSGPNLESFFIYNPVANLPFFLVGSVLCLLVMSDRIPNNNLTVVTLFTVILPFAVYLEFVPMVNRYNSLAELWMAPGFVCVIAAGAARDLRSTGNRFTLMSSRPLVWGGDISYAFYMLHALVLGGVLYVAQHRFLPTSPLYGEIFMVGYILLAVFVAALGHRLIELPGQRLLLEVLPSRGPHRRITRSRRSSVAEANRMSDEIPTLP
jgi:peptidoglycan/LPS O-acetylase OafA/YrhL